MEGQTLEGQTLLRRFGERLRARRAERGLSVAEVARASGVSRRHLTEAEAGRANPSLLVVARLARALGTDLGSLLDLPTRARRRRRVALFGLRGAGKSTLGRRLARELEAPFVELDRRVEERAGMPLAEVFDLHGPEAFERFEAEALEEVLAEGEGLVLATAGSIVTRAATFERLRETCRCVWLRADAEDHFRRVEAQGDARPMRGRPRARQELAEILARREPLYARCELSVETSRADLEATLRELVARVSA